MLDNVIESDETLKALADKGDAAALAKALAVCPALAKELVRRKVVARYGETMAQIESGKLSTWGEARRFMGGE